jgi:hypothetical protein
VPSNLAELFAQLRSGAANVAGVDFQVSLSVMLLSAGRTGSVVGLPVVAVSPEAFEDIDCHLADGSRLLIQNWFGGGQWIRTVALGPHAYLGAIAILSALTESADRSDAFSSRDHGPPSAFLPYMLRRQNAGETMTLPQLPVPNDFGPAFRDWAEGKIYVCSELTRRQDQYLL